MQVFQADLYQICVKMYEMIHQLKNFLKKAAQMHPALGIGRAMVFGTNVELVNPCKAGRPQGVDVSRYSKGL